MLLDNDIKKIFISIISILDKSKLNQSNGLVLIETLGRIDIAMSKRLRRRNS